MRDKWLGEIIQCNETINQVADGLEHLATAFDRIGNPSVADELFTKSMILRKSTNEYSKLINDEIHRGYVQAQEMTGAVLQAALAGCIIGKQEKGE